MAKKQYNQGFEMMAIVAVVGLIIMFMNSGGDLAGEAAEPSKTKPYQLTNKPIICGDSDGNTWEGYITETNPPVAHCYWL